MANLVLQVTIPASGVVNLAAALSVPTGGRGNVVGQPPVGRVYVQWLQFQNNSAHNCRFGTSPNVSVTTPAAVNGGTAGFGTLLTPGGAGAQSTPINYSTYIDDWYVAGTAGDVIDAQALA